MNDIGATTAVPRAFRKVHQRLEEISSRAPHELADPDLRESLFDLARDLAAAFDPENAIAPGVKKLRKWHFDTAIDYLLDERGFAEAPQQKQVVEGLMQNVLRVRDALSQGDVGTAFAYGPSLVLGVASIQAQHSAARMQVLATHSYFFWIVGECDRFRTFLRRCAHIAGHCEAIARENGERLLDAEPEFKNGATLRRIRTYALASALSTLFNHRLSTAPKAAFVVKQENYDELAGLVCRFQALLDFDPGAESVYNEILILQAHLVRAAYNLSRRAAPPEERDRWAHERAAQREQLVTLVESRFAISECAEENAARLLTVAMETAEGHAGARTLDIIGEELGASHPNLVRALSERRERLVLATSWDSFRASRVAEESDPD